MPTQDKFYVTTFCNFAHRVKDGKPVDHECYQLPVKALKAEIAGDIDKANDILRTELLRKPVKSA